MIIVAGRPDDFLQFLLSTFGQQLQRADGLEVLDEADKKVNGLERKRIRLEFELIEATLKQQ